MSAYSGRANRCLSVVLLRTMAFALMVIPTASVLGQHKKTPASEQQTDASNSVDEKASSLVMPDAFAPVLDVKDEKVKQFLRQALEQNATDVRTSDPILDGFLEVIESQGSLVRARLDPLLSQASYDEPSPLQHSDDATVPLPQLSPAPHTESVPDSGKAPSPYSIPQPTLSGPPILPPGLLNPAPVDGFVNEGKRLPMYELTPAGLRPASPNNPLSNGPQEEDFHLAEQLLMTARILSKKPALGERQKLIQLLREEAARCLNSDGQLENVPSLIPRIDVQPKSKSIAPASGTY